MIYVNGVCYMPYIYILNLGGGVGDYGCSYLRISIPLYIYEIYQGAHYSRYGNTVDWSLIILSMSFFVAVS